MAQRLLGNMVPAFSSRLHGYYLDAHWEQIFHERLQILERLFDKKAARVAHRYLNFPLLLPQKW